jgi:Host cell surface-exposed lipoprotein/Glucodextranase, domain B
MGFREDMKASNERFKQGIKAGNEKFKKDIKEVGKSKGSKKDSSDKWRTVPKWQVIALLIVFFPIGMYLLWRQDRWSRRTKKIVTWATSIAVIAFFTLAIIFAPPTVTVTSSLASVKANSYQLTGKISPSGSLVTVNGVQAKVAGDTFSANVQLEEGDNTLKVVVVSGSKRTEQVFKIHRYTKAEVTAQDEAAAEKKAAAAVDAEVERLQAATDKAKVDADAAAQAAKDKAAADAAAKAKADAAAAAAVTVSQKNALRKAKDYLNYSAFSHDGLVDQLVYEQFSAADATYGADNSGADWNQQAAKKAKDYMSYSSFSRGGLIGQLEYDKFTANQATYGANAVGL